jgi:hypothetical protein
VRPSTRSILDSLGRCASEPTNFKFEEELELLAPRLQVRIELHRFLVAIETSARYPDTSLSVLSSTFSLFLLNFNCLPYLTSTSPSPNLCSSLPLVLFCGLRSVRWRLHIQKHSHGVTGVFFSGRKSNSGNWPLATVNVFHSALWNLEDVATTSVAWGGYGVHAVEVGMCEYVGS